MSQYDDWDDDEDEKSEPEPRVSETEKLQRALKREREARKEAERKARLESLRRQHPGLTDEDADLIAATDPAQWDRLAPRLVKESRQESSPEEIEAQRRSEAEQLQRREEEEELAQAGNLHGTPPSVPGAPRKIGRDEALQLYKRNPSKFHEMKQAGLIDLGVSATTRAGGATTFGNAG